MRTATLISLGIGGVGTLTGASVAISYLYGGESIREHIENLKKSEKKIFLISEREDLGDIKTKYQLSTDTKRPKPKNEKGNPVDKEKLVEWCSNNVNSKFKSEQDELYQSIFSWCFLNSNTLSQEMELDNRQFYSSQENTGTEWQGAWDKYSQNTDDSKKIKTGDNLVNLNGKVKAEGGKALHAWCTSNKTKKLYEDSAEEIYVLFKQWCTKDK